MHWVSPTKALKNRSARRIAWVSFVRYNGRRRTAYLFVDNRAFESEVLSVPRIFCAPMRRGAVSGGVRCGLAAWRSFGSVFWCVAFELHSWGFWGHVVVFFDRKRPNRRYGAGGDGIPTPVGAV